MEAPTLSDNAGITLDGLRLADVDRLIALEDEPLRRWYGRTAPLTQEGAERLIERASHAWDQTTDRFIWAIRERDTSPLIGVVEIWQSPGIRSYYIGIWLGPSFRGKGMAKRAMSLVIDYAFDSFKWPWIQAQIEPENLDSINLALSLGFELAGVGWRHGDRAEINEYKLRRGEWLTRRAQLDTRS